MYKSTLTASVHSPDGDSTTVPSNSTYEGEVMTRTGGGSCSKLPSNITWREISLNGIVFSSATLLLQLEKVSLSNNQMYLDLATKMFVIIKPTNSATNYFHSLYAGTSL